MDEAPRSADPSSLPDSLLHRTDAGRLVVGGGGIQPDTVVADTVENAFRRSVLRDGRVRSFARRWADAHTERLRTSWDGRPEAFVREFELPDSAYPAFLRFVAGEEGARTGTEPATSPERILADLDRSGPSFSAPDVRAARSRIEADITAYLGQRLFGPSMYVRLQNRTDDFIRAAEASWPTAGAWADRYPVSNP